MKFEMLVGLHVTDDDTYAEYRKAMMPIPEQYALVAIPHWLACLLLGVPPVWARRRRGSAPPRICRMCGYDLRATPDRCPECGTISSECESPANGGVTSTG